MLRLLFFCFAPDVKIGTGAKKVTKEKASFGQRLRRPKNSSALLTQFATRLYGAGFLPIIATIELHQANRQQ